MADTFRLQIATPERLVIREDVDEAQIPATNGYLGILPGHAPLLAQLRPGEISYRREGRVRQIAVSGGLVEVLPGQTKVLALTAEKAEEIDVKRAQAARTRAEERLRTSSPDMDVDRAKAAIERALVRIQVAGRFPK